MNGTKTSFKVGETYYTRSLCDYNCVFEMTVTKRTKCFVYNEYGKRFKVRTDPEGEHEYVRAGNWSMAHAWYSNATDASTAP